MKQKTICAKLLGALGGKASGKARKRSAAAKVRKPTAKPGGPHRSKKAYTRKGKASPKQRKLF